MFWNFRYFLKKTWNIIKWLIRISLLINVKKTHLNLLIFYGNINSNTGLLRHTVHSTMYATVPRTKYMILRDELKLKNRKLCFEFSFNINSMW